MFAVHNYFLIIVLILFVKAPLSWGFSISGTNAYLQKAQSLKLHENPKWLLMGHYEKTFRGHRSPFRGTMFIDPEGFNSPEREITATINALFSESEELTKSLKRHPQCQFLARRNWLVKMLGVAPADILPCEERENWKKQLSANKVSLIFASSDLGNPASSFGHTFLKLINPANAANKDLIDYGINYAADADSSEGLLYAMKGLFGVYGGRFTMLPYHQKIREYINLEGRDIWEYNLDLSPAEVDELVNHLLELENSRAPYFFFSDNCSYQILKTLDMLRPESRFSERYKAWVIPVDTLKTISRNSNLIQSKVYKKSLKTDYLDSFVKLNILQKKALDAAVEQLTIPPDYELTNVEKAEVYETAMKFLGVKAYRTQKDLDEEKYKLFLQRASLGPITSEVKSAPKYSPEQSHDSSAIYLGGGSTPLSDYYSFKFRSAYHDLEQNQAGAVPFSQNNIGTFEIRHYTEIQKTVIERATFIDLLNTNPVTQLDKNISWKIKAEVLDNLRPSLEAGGGMSFDILENARLVYFISGSAVEHNYFAGPEMMFLINATEEFGISFDLAYWAQYETTPYLKFTAKMNYQLQPNFDVQLKANDQRDYQFQLVRNFIF